MNTYNYKLTIGTLNKGKCISESGLEYEYLAQVKSPSIKVIGIRYVLVIHSQEKNTSVMYNTISRAVVFYVLIYQSTC